jgi:hypothetical protein
MSSVLEGLFGGPKGGTVGGNVIVPGNYDPTKRGTAKVGSGLIKPTRNMSTAGGSSVMNASAAAGGGGGGGNAAAGGAPAGNAAAGGAPAAAATPNMGATIIPGNTKSPLQLTSANVATDGKKEGVFGGLFGGLFGGRRRKSRRSNKAKKAKKAKKTRRSHKRKSHRRRR